MNNTYGTNKISSVRATQEEKQAADLYMSRITNNLIIQDMFLRLNELKHMNNNSEVILRDMANTLANTGINFGWLCNKPLGWVVAPINCSKFILVYFGTVNGVQTIKYRFLEKSDEKNLVIWDYSLNRVITPQEQMMMYH